MIIYKATNKETGKIYIGQTVRTLKKRRREHERNPSGYFGESVKKYGLKAFVFEVIDRTAKTIEELNELEIMYIEKFNCVRPNGYNLQTGGLNSKVHQDTKEKISKSKHFPIDCKCVKTGITYSFYNAGEVTEIGVDPRNVHNAFRQNRIGEGYYWKRRNEEFPSCIAEYRFERYSQSQKGRKHSKEHIEKRVSHFRGKKRPKEVVDSVRNSVIKSVGVAVVDNKGTFYRTVAEASEKTGAVRSNIRKTIRGERKTTAGLSFRYVTEEEVRNYELKN